MLVNIIALNYEICFSNLFSPNCSYQTLLHLGTMTLKIMTLFLAHLTYILKVIIQSDTLMYIIALNFEICFNKLFSPTCSPQTRLHPGSMTLMTMTLFLVHLMYILIVIMQSDTLMYIIALNYEICFNTLFSDVCGQFRKL
jgi:hypothetical protein